eukprot:3821292-Karenia_brevis.AAC.1
MSREQVLSELEKFGEVMAIYFEPDIFKGRCVFKGAGFVQFRHPSSLLKAWNYQHCCETWKSDAEQHGVDRDQIGFMMIEETRDGPR